MEERAAREVLSSAAEHLLSVLQDETARTEKAVLRVRPWGFLPSGRNAALGEKTDHPLAESGVGAHEVPAHARVAAREHHRPGEVSGCVQEARPPSGAPHGGHPLLRRPGKERRLRPHADPVRYSPIAQHRDAHRRNPAAKDHLVRPDVVDAAHPDVDPCGESRRVGRGVRLPHGRGNRHPPLPTGASKG